MKKMLNIRNNIIIVLCVTISAIFGIVYAAFTQNLTINGKATVKKSSWSIKFSNLGTVQTTGSATQVTAPTINTNDTFLKILENHYHIKLALSFYI